MLRDLPRVGRLVWRFAMLRAARTGLCWVLLALFVAPMPVWAQAPRRDIGWREAGLLATGVLALMALDQRVARRAEASDDGMRRALAPFREFGAAPVFVTVSAGVLLTGLVSGDADVTRSGGRLVATAALAGAAVQVMKYGLGRQRPMAREGAWDFDPLSGATSLASGHTTMAFAMATALSHEIDRPVVSFGLYSVASLTAMSRIADDKHWLSDVVAGAAIGVTAAKFVYGEWTVFGIRAPRVLAGNGGAEVSWQVAF